MPDARFELQTIRAAHSVFASEYALSASVYDASADRHYDVRLLVERDGGELVLTASGAPADVCAFAVDASRAWATDVFTRDEVA